MLEVLKFFDSVDHLGALIIVLLIVFHGTATIVRAARTRVDE